MGYELKITKLAEDDLDGIVSYIVNQLYNPQAASDLADEIARCYEVLRTSPLIYPLCQDRRLEREGYHRAIVKNFLVLFRVDEAEKRVTVYRVIYGARDYMKLL